jgi:pimeloyl-ACP methyl ester carboxylesterase
VSTAGSQPSRLDDLLEAERDIVDRLAASDPARALSHARTLQSLSDHDPDLDAEISRLAEAARQAAIAGAEGRAAAVPVTVKPDLATPPGLSQEVRHCTTRDGVRIAYAVSGSGPPLVRAAHWMSHLEHDWKSPVWGHWIEGLSANHQLFRYDERGNDLSDWDVADLSFESMVADLESIIDAAGLRQVWLLGVSQSCAVSVAYATRHPARVAGMVLAAVTAGRRREIDWITRDVGRVFPREWEQFRDAVPEAERVVRRHRERFDPAALAGVPAHVTVMYPFVPPPQIDNIVLDCDYPEYTGLNEMDLGERQVRGAQIALPVEPQGVGVDLHYESVGRRSMSMAKRSTAATGSPGSMPSNRAPYAHKALSGRAARGARPTGGHAP